LPERGDYTLLMLVHLRMRPLKKTSIQKPSVHRDICQNKCQRRRGLHTRGKADLHNELFQQGCVLFGNCFVYALKLNRIQGRMDNDNVATDLSVEVHDGSGSNETKCCK